MARVKEKLTVNDVRDADMVLRARYSRPLRFRLWLAIVLCRLAAWLAGAETDERERLL